MDLYKSADGMAAAVWGAVISKRMSADGEVAAALLLCHEFKDGS